MPNLEHEYAQVRVNFPQDLTSPVVDFFGKGESSKFFQTFNGIDAEYNRKRSEITLYGTKFDMVALKEHTSANVTKEVTIKADTVFLSEPMDINYRLKIRARIVSIDKKITMGMPLNELQNEMELSTHFETRFVFSNQTLMRHRQFGLIDIIDEAPVQVPHKHCQPSIHKSNETTMITKEWFDPILINLMYVSSATIQPNNNELAAKISTFNLDYHSNRDVVNDLRAFASAQKFSKILELTKLNNAHGVPSYTLQTIKDLSEIMYQKLRLYFDNENRQHDQLTNAMMAIDEMKIQFGIVEQQQEQYFFMEQIVLEQIFAATDNLWNFTFQHRNASDVAINGAISETGSLINQLQEQELKTMLAEAQSSVNHYNDVVDEYKKDIAR